MFRSRTGLYEEVRWHTLAVVVVLRSRTMRQLPANQGATLTLARLFTPHPERTRSSIQRRPAPWVVKATAQTHLLLIAQIKTKPTALSTPGCAAHRLSL